MKFSHGSKFDSRKPAAARFVAIASSCTDLRSIHSLSLSLHAFSFVFAMLDEVVSIRRKLWFLTEYSREGLGDSSKLKCVDHRLSYDLGWSIDVQFQKRKKKEYSFSNFQFMSQCTRNSNSETAIAAIVVHSERDGSGEWKNAIQRLKSKMEEARERERESAMF